MKIRLIYPKWPKLSHQTEFHLPPHGPVVFAACVPPEHDLKFTDENLTPVNFDEDVDLVCISMMLTSQAPRGWEIGDEFRARGKKVIFGGISTALHPDETAKHADSVFLGEAEGRFEQVLKDLEAGQLKKRYDYLDSPASVELVGTARRDILDRSLYNYRGTQMLDLVHASRGCRFNCYPCCVRYLGGRNFRPRPIDKVVAEVESIPNNRLFFVDNSMAQNKQWEIDLFNALAPLKRSIVSHPIQDDPDVLAAAAKAGAWYVYQAVFDTSDYIKERIKRYHDHGIKVEGTILLGLDEHTEDDIKRLVEFLMKIELDLAEFTVLVPFPGTRTWNEFESSGRILHKDWRKFTADEVVIKPKHMSPDRLQELYHWAWDTFYHDEPQVLKMGRVFKHAVRREEKLGIKNRFAAQNKPPEAPIFGRTA